MKKNNEIMQDEINIVALFKNLWEGKIWIFFYIIVSLLFVFAYNYFSPPRHFIAKTEVKPITSWEFARYDLFNSFGLISFYPTKKALEKGIQLFQKKSEIYNKREISIEKDKNRENTFITKSQIAFDDLFFEQLERGGIFQNLFKKYKFVNEKNFNNKKDYDEAVSAMVSSIKFYAPVKLEILPNGVTKRSGRKNWIIEFKYNDAKKWKKVLYEANIMADKLARKSIIEKFNNTVEVYKMKKNHFVEDLKTALNFESLDYKITQQKALKYLEGQAAIAREIGRKLNTDETISAMVTSRKFLNYDTRNPIALPYYLSGYKAIEKEISLLKSSLGDPSNVQEGSTKILLRSIDNQKIMDRVTDTFNNTPIISDKNFSIMSVETESTNFKRNGSLIFYVLAAFFGFLVGIFHLFVKNNFVNKQI